MLKLRNWPILMMFCLMGCQAATYPFAHEDGQRKIIYDQDRELDIEKLIQPPITLDLYVGAISGLSDQNATKVRHHLRKLLAEAMIPLTVNKTKAVYGLKADCKVEKGDQETALICIWEITQSDEEDKTERKEIRHVIETNNFQFALNNLTILQAKEVVPFVKSYVTLSPVLNTASVVDNKLEEVQGIKKVIPVVSTPARVTMTLKEIKGVSSKQRKLFEGFLRTLLFQKDINLVKGSASDYQIKGVVKLSSVKGQEKVTMSWEILDKDVSLGTISQENLISKGQFDKIWQSQIYPISQGVADGVVALVNEQKKIRKEQ